MKAEAMPDLVQHQEVSEGQTVTGRHMRFTAAVYGELASTGGRVQLDDMLGWGCARSPGGEIHVAKRAFNSTIAAPGGTVQLASAETCLIIGHEVRLKQAVNCKVIAHRLHLGTAVGCSIAARTITIGSTEPRKFEPTVVTVMMPALDDLGPVLAPLNEELAQLQRGVDLQSSTMATLKADAGLSQFLVIRGKLRAGIVKLTPEQESGYALMLEKYSDAAQALEAAVAEKRALSQSHTALRTRIQALRDERAALLSECQCRITHVHGETLVRHAAFELDESDISLLPENLHTQVLNRNDVGVTVIFSGHHGHLDWRAPLQ